MRVEFVGHLENARIPIQIDLGFGDAITPAPVEAELRTLLDFPAAKLLTYPRESVLAEKFEAIVSLGMANSRMKDLHDIRSLLREFAFKGAVLSEAIAKTFTTRGTKLPTGQVLVFTSEFFDNEDKKKQWRAFCNKNNSYVAEASLGAICMDIAGFLMPVLEMVRRNERLQVSWLAGGPWR